MSGIDERVVWVEVEPAPVEAPSVATRRGERPLGWVFTTLGFVGLGIAILIIVFGLLFVDDLASGAEGGLAVASDVLDAAVDTIDTAEALLQSTGETLATVDDALRHIHGGFGELETAVGDMSTLLGGDLASSVDDLRDALPGLIAAGDSLDATLRGLAAFGFPHDPDQSMGDAFRDVEASLDGMPEQLRSEGRLLESARGDLASTGGSLLRIEGSLSNLGSELSSTSRLFARYRADVASAKTVVAEARDNVRAWRPVSLVALVVLGLVIAVWQLVPLHLGSRLRSSEPVERRPIS